MFFSLKVINDWQTWSETQNAEVEQIKVSLEQYNQAYNEAVAQVEQLKGQGGGDTQDPEVEKLKAAVKTKDIEIEELSETLDRSVLKIINIKLLFIINIKWDKGFFCK